MGLKKLADKLATYNERLERGKAEKIEPDHIEKVLEKLRRKATDLEAEIASAVSEDKKERLTRKLGIAREHIERAEWLMQELD